MKVGDKIVDHATSASVLAAIAEALGEELPVDMEAEA